jgi:hypothetical protein
VLIMVAGARRDRAEDAAPASATGMGAGFVATLSWLWNVLAYAVAITAAISTTI